MPTTYTHDLFGRDVYRRLPAEMKQVIRRNGDLYRIGLHGPDILFYYMISKNPVSQYGVKMHHTPARAFFEQGTALVRSTGDEALLAYLLGFGCHYLLDSQAHPFVNRMAREGVVSHTMLEKEFDRKLMMDTGRNPYSYHPSDAVVPKYEYAKVIHRAIPAISAQNIWISLHMMKFLTNRMVCDDGGRRRKIIHGIMRVAGKKTADTYAEYFMMPQPKEGISLPLTRMQQIFDGAVRTAPEGLRKIYDAALRGTPLSTLWDKTYSG
ncbi:MAG: zinc dependent phospholipase C family protein [Blautia sp.]|nr:zinc dependent phospholipase C family protein [Blautia sp.]